jgi:hypothetical protein
VLVSHNHYTSADFSGGFALENGWLDISDNQLTSLKVAGCPGLIALFAENNALGADAVDSVLETLDTLGRYGGYLDLQGNAPPSAAGLQHAESLRQRNWTVNLASQESSRRSPDQRVSSESHRGVGELQLTRKSGASPALVNDLFTAAPGGYGWAPDYLAIATQVNSGILTAR